MRLNAGDHLPAAVTPDPDVVSACSSSGMWSLHGGREHDRRDPPTTGDPGSGWALHRALFRVTGGRVGTERARGGRLGTLFIDEFPAGPAEPRRPAVLPRRRPNLVVVPRTPAPTAIPAGGATSRPIHARRSTSPVERFPVLARRATATRQSACGLGSLPRNPTSRVPRAGRPRDPVVILEFAPARGSARSGC